MFYTLQNEPINYTFVTTHLPKILKLISFQGNIFDEKALNQHSSKGYTGDPNIAERMVRTHSCNRIT